MENKKQLPHGDESKVNEYYLGVSKKLRIAKYIVLLFMVAAFILTLWGYRSRLTYDNLRYILRDIDKAGHTTMENDAVYYTASDTNVYLYFRGDLAVGSSGGIDFHRALGSRSFSDKVNFKSPVLAGSDKYMVAYDTGGNSFYVYNSISRVYSETLKHKIICCAASDSGNFAVLTKNDVGDSVARIYDKNFALTCEVTRAGYAYSIGFLSSDRLYVCESYSSDATLYTNVVVYTVGKDDIDLSVTVQGTALDASAVKGGYAIVTSDGVYLYDSAFEQKSYHTVGTSDILYGDVTSSGVGLLLDKNEVGAREEVMVVFADGTEYKTEVTYGARGISLLGKRAAVLYDDVHLICSDNGQKTKEIPSGAKKMLGMDEKSVVVCYNDYAKVFEVN